MLARMVIVVNWDTYVFAVVVVVGRKAEKCLVMSDGRRWRAITTYELRICFEQVVTKRG